MDPTATKKRWLPPVYFLLANGVIPLFVWLITVKFIRHEEASLAEQFGEAYTRYKRSVRRWI